MFAALQRYLQLRSLTIADLFPIAGSDHGTIEERKIPAGSVVKTGTLNDVSALAGILPTRNRGLVWFAIINRGTNLEGLRDQQDSFLQALVNHWGTASSRPVAITPTSPIRSASADLGDQGRNEALQSALEVRMYQGN